MPSRTGWEPEPFLPVFTLEYGSADFSTLKHENYCSDTCFTLSDGVALHTGLIRLPLCMCAFSRVDCMEQPSLYQQGHGMPCPCRNGWNAEKDGETKSDCS